jgi:hypothetical protein
VLVPQAQLKDGEPRFRAEIDGDIRKLRSQQMPRQAPKQARACGVMQRGPVLVVLRAQQVNTRPRQFRPLQKLRDASPGGRAHVHSGWVRKHANTWRQLRLPRERRPKSHGARITGWWRCERFGNGSPALRHKTTPPAHRSDCNQLGRRNEAVEKMVDVTRRLTKPRLVGRMGGVDVTA